MVRRAVDVPQTLLSGQRPTTIAGKLFTKCTQEALQLAHCFDVRSSVL
jgi:hypothetical protein